MAVNKQNVVVDGSSGKFGKNLVFRQRAGVTMLSKNPVFRDDYAPTDKQIKQRFKFIEATWYASNAVADPELKERYQAKAKANQSAYNVAFKDYTTAPVLHFVDMENYDGAVGGTITCRITDVLAVVSVKVSLVDNNGELIEEGMAVQSAIKLDWVYTATVAHTPVAGNTIVVKMTDTPGNVYKVEELIRVKSGSSSG